MCIHNQTLIKLEYKKGTRKEFEFCNPLAKFEGYGRIKKMIPLKEIPTYPGSNFERKYTVAWYQHLYWLYHFVLFFCFFCLRKNLNIFNFSFALKLFGFFA